MAAMRAWAQQADRPGQQHRILFVASVTVVDMSRCWDSKYSSGDHWQLVERKQPRQLWGPQGAPPVWQQGLQTPEQESLKIFHNRQGIQDGKASQGDSASMYSCGACLQWDGITCAGNPHKILLRLGNTPQEGSRLDYYGANGGEARTFRGAQIVATSGLCLGGTLAQTRR
jgi:hypothetical protein